MLSFSTLRGPGDALSVLNESSAIALEVFHSRREFNGKPLIIFARYRFTPGQYFLPPQPLYLLHLITEGNLRCFDPCSSQPGEPSPFSLQFSPKGMSAECRSESQGIFVLISPALLHRRLQVSDRGHYNPPVGFAQGKSQDPASPVAAALLADWLRHAAGLPGHERKALLSEELFFSLLLESIPRQSLGDFPPQAGHKETPWYVQAVEQSLDAHLTDPISLPALALRVGISPRTLQDGFKRFRGQSPMKALRQQRLLQVHRELSNPDHSTTVTATAMKWGFSHLGRFSSYYLAHFNERPSETLRKALSAKAGHPSGHRQAAASLHRNKLTSARRSGPSSYPTAQ